MIDLNIGTGNAVLLDSGDPLTFNYSYKFKSSLTKERISLSIWIKNRGEKEVIMSDLKFTSKIFPVKPITTGWLTKLKKVVYRMRTNVDIFSLLAFVNGGREGASLGLPPPSTDSRCILEASLTRTLS